MDDDCDGASKANMGTPVAGEATWETVILELARWVEYWPGHFAAKPVVRHIGASQADFNSDSQSLTTWYAFAHCNLQGWSKKPPAEVVARTIFNP